MEIDFDSIIQAGNNKGVGFLKISKDKRDLFDINQQVECFLNFDSVDASFFARIKEYSHSKGVYVPKKICKSKNLLGRKVTVNLKKLNGFHARVGPEGRVYIPLEIAHKLNLKKNDIVRVLVNVNSEVVEKYSLIRFRKRKKSSEFFLLLEPKRNGQSVILKIDKLQSSIGRVANKNMSKLLDGLYFANINKNRLILFGANKVPMFLKRNLKLEDLAYYLGCYFADGTKKGNSWGICASTLEQGKFYLDTHKSLTFEPALDFTLSFTKTKNKKINEESLVNKWGDYLKISPIKKRFRFAIGANLGKTNDSGTLIMREHKALLLIIYNRLLELLINEIEEGKNKSLAMDFICGVLEGDGSASARKRGHIIITTNKKELKILDKIFRCSNIKYKILEDKGKNRGTIRIGALEILKNFDELKDKLFIYYPKRRQRLFERLTQMGCVKYILGKQEKSPGWVKAELKKQGLLNNKYEPTKKGKEIAAYLQSVTVH